MNCNLIILLLFVYLACAADPTVELHNAAVPGLKMPVMGIGTGGYGKPGNVGGEYWDNEVAYKAVTEWLSVGGVRIDTANDYHTQEGIGRAIVDSKRNRSELFITSKVAWVKPMGYQEILQQADDLLKELRTNYVDLLLIHWPGPDPGNFNVDWPCYKGQHTFQKCREESWRAMEVIFRSGKAKAIGVSNYEENHLQEIFKMNGLLPAVNQVEFHPYWHEDNLVEFCRSKNIQYNGYSPAGCPDHMSSPNNTNRWSVQVKEQPTITTIASKYNKSPVQVILKWSLQQGLVVNPRTMNISHMKENLNIFDFELTKQDMNQIANIRPPSDPKVCANPTQIP